MDNYNLDVATAYDRNSNLEALEKTIKNALIKYNKHKASASSASVAKAKELGNIGVHPHVLSRVSSEDLVIMDFQNEIKNFRPKLNAIELMYSRYKKIEELENLQKIIKSQNKELTKKEDMERVRQMAQQRIDEAEEKQQEELKIMIKETLKRQYKNEEPTPVLEEQDTKLHLSKHDRRFLKKVIFALNS
jgi:hypothetical protein